MIDIMKQASNPVGRPRGKKSREQTVKEILLAARKCFADRGFDGATIKEVASMVGKTNRAIYQYYDSKEALYFAVLDDAQSAILPRYLEAMSEEGGFRDKLKRILVAFAMAYKEEPDITAFLGSVPIEMNRHDTLKQYAMDDSSNIMMTMFQLIDDAKANGEIVSSVPTEELFFCFVGAPMGIGIMKHGMQAADMEQSTQAFIELIDPSLFGGT